MRIDAQNQQGIAALVADDEQLAGGIEGEVARETDVAVAGLDLEERETAAGLIDGIGGQAVGKAVRGVDEFSVGVSPWSEVDVELIFVSCPSP